MTARRARAVGVVTFFGLAMTSAIWLQQVTGGAVEALGENVAFLGAFALFVVLGAVLLDRRPGHVMGPLFALVGLLPAIGVSGDALAAWFLLRGATPPWSVVVLAWTNNWYWYVVLAAIVVYVPLLPRRPAALAAVAVGGVDHGAGLTVAVVVSAVSERIVLETRAPDGAELSVVNRWGSAAAR